MDIFWYTLAKRQLKATYFFYAEIAGKDVAKKMVKGIATRTNQLLKHPKSGILEQRLANRPFEYRYIIYRHFKIYYFVASESIQITAVFDSRQDPNKVLALL